MKTVAAQRKGLSVALGLMAVCPQFNKLGSIGRPWCFNRQRRTYAIGKEGVSFQRRALRKRRDVALEVSSAVGMQPCDVRLWKFEKAGRRLVMQASRSGRRKICASGPWGGAHQSARRSARLRRGMHASVGNRRVAPRPGVTADEALDPALAQSMSINIPPRFIHSRLHETSPRVSADGSANRMPCESQPALYFGTAAQGCSSP